MHLHPCAVCPSLRPGARGPPPAALQAVGALSVHPSGEQVRGPLPSSRPLEPGLAGSVGWVRRPARAVLAQRPPLQPTQPQLPHREPEAGGGQ